MKTSEVQTLSRGATVTFVGGLAGAGLIYLTGIVVARRVGAELLGVYFLSLIWVNLGSTIARMGFGDALLRFVPPALLAGDRDAAARIIKTTVFLGAAVATLLAVILYVGFVVLRLIPANALLTSYLSWFVWTLPLHAGFILLLVVVQAHQKMARLTAVRDILQPVLLIGLTVLLVMLAGPKMGLFGGFALSLILSIPVAAFLVRGVAPGAFSASGWFPLPVLLSFSVPVMAGDASHYVYRWVDTLLIERFLTLRDVGIYNAASRTAMLITLVLIGANAIFASVAAAYFNTAQTQKLEKALELSIRWCLIVSLPIVLVFILGGDWILTLWGNEFREAGTALAILSVAHLVGIPVGLFAYTLVMSNRQVMEMADTLAVLAVLLGLNLALIPRLGIAGAGVAVLSANLVGLVVRYTQVRRVVGVRPLAASLMKPLIAAAMALVAGLLLREPIRDLVAGGTATPEDPLILLALLACLSLVIAGAFLGPYLAIDSEGRSLLRLSLPGLPGWFSRFRDGRR